VAAIALVATVALMATALAVLQTRRTDAAGPGSAATVPAASPDPACTPLAYQPCGRPAAAFTDGLQCTDDHADYDADPTNGCEAAPDTLDGTPLTRRISSAGLVPVADVDRYPLEVGDDLQWLCDGALDVTLTAPAGVAMRLDVLRSGSPLASTVSTDGGPAKVTLDDPSCLGDDSTELQARVSWVGDARTAVPYTLERDGSY